MEPAKCKETEEKKESKKKQIQLAKKYKETKEKKESKKELKVIVKTMTGARLPVIITKDSTVLNLKQVSQGNSMFWIVCHITNLTGYWE